MVQQRQGKWFQPEWRLTLFTLLLLPVMVSLGFWQLDRAGEKRQLQQEYTRRYQMAPVPITAIARDGDLRHVPVTLRGRFITGESWLLDNRVHQGKVGYEVVMPFQLSENGQQVLVNRGWVAGNPDRRILPAIATPAEELSLSGRIHVPLQAPFTLGDPAPAAGWPRVVQHLPWPELAGRNLFIPHSVRLDAGSPAALTANWVVVNISPEKHTGYAVQWFAMSLALLLLYIAASTPLRQRLARRKV